jgi:hypothetical protein
VQPRLVVASEIGVRLVLGRLLDALLLDVHDHRLPLGGHAADPGGGEHHLLAGEPVAGVDDEVAQLHLTVVHDEIADAADLPVGGEDPIVEHVLDRS